MLYKPNCQNVRGLAVTYDRPLGSNEGVEGLSSLLDSLVECL